MSSNRHSFPPAIPRGESSYRGNYLMGRQNSRLVEPISSGSMQPSYRGYGSEDRGSFSQSNTNNRKRVGVACARCRKRKIRCSGDPGDNSGCINCRAAGSVDRCVFLRVQCQELPVNIPTPISTAGTFDMYTPSTYPETTCFTAPGALYGTNSGFEPATPAVMQFNHPVYPNPGGRQFSHTHGGRRTLSRGSGSVAVPPTYGLELLAVATDDARGLLGMGNTTVPEADFTVGGIPTTLCNVDMGSTYAVSEVPSGISPWVSALGDDSRGDFDSAIRGSAGDVIQKTLSPDEYFSAVSQPSSTHGALSHNGLQTSAPHDDQYPDNVSGQVNHMAFGYSPAPRSGDQRIRSLPPQVTCPGGIDRSDGFSIGSATAYGSEFGTSYDQYSRLDTSSAPTVDAYQYTPSTYPRAGSKQITTSATPTTPIIPSAEPLKRITSGDSSGHTSTGYRYQQRNSGHGSTSAISESRVRLSSGASFHKRDGPVPVHPSPVRSVSGLSRPPTQRSSSSGSGPSRVSTQLTLEDYHCQASSKGR